MVGTKTTVILTALGVGWYLSSSMSIIRITWLGLTLLDTYKALRSSRPNGRKIGIVTRRKVMRDALVCWVIYIVGQSLSPLHALFSWIPFYNPLINLLWILFAFTRLASSTVIFNSLVPYIKPYETPIDLTFLLLHSLSVLVIHYTVHLPFSIIRSSLQPLANITSTINRYFSSSPHTVFGEVEKTTVDIDALPNTPPLSAPRDAGQSTSRPRGPRQPHNPTQIIVVSPSSSPAPGDALTEAGPSTPRRRHSPESISNTYGLQVPVSDAQPLRRSPRKTKAQQNYYASEGTAKFDIESLLLHPATKERSKKTVIGPRPKSINVPSRSVSVIDLTNDEKSTGKSKGKEVNAMDAESTTSGTTKIRSTTRAHVRRVETSASLAQTDSIDRASKAVSRRVRDIPRSASQSIPLPSMATASISRDSSTAKAIQRSSSSTQSRSRIAVPASSHNASNGVSRPRAKVRKVAVAPVEEESEEHVKVGEKRRIVGGETGRKRQRVQP